MDQISSNGADLSAYELEPQLVTALFDAEQRSKRQLVTYDAIPPVMVQAVFDVIERVRSELSTTVVVAEQTVPRLLKIATDV